MLDDDVADGDRVPRGEAVAPVVVGQAELAEARDGLDLDILRVGPEPESQVAAADGDGLLRRRVRGADRAVAAAVGRVDPVVQSPEKAVDPELGVPRAEPGQHHPAVLGVAVAVIVAEEPDVGRGGHQDAAAAGEHAVGEGERVGEDGGPLVHAVAVAVLEPADPARRAGRRDSRSSRRRRGNRPSPRRWRPGWPPAARRQPARSSGRDSARRRALALAVEPGGLAAPPEPGSESRERRDPR